MGFASGMIASGGNLHAGLMGALAGAAAGLAFGYIGGHVSGMYRKAALEGFTGGALSSVEGGSFKDGFMGAFVASMSSGLTRRIPDNGNVGDFEKVAVASALGGTASQLTGGSFANGAWSAAFQHLFNDVRHDSQNKNATQEKPQVKDKVPSKVVVLRKRTKVGMHGRIYRYQLQNKEGQPVTGSGYYFKEHIKVMHTTGAIPASNQNFTQIHNGVIVDYIGYPTSLSQSGKIDILVHQTFTVKYEGKSYMLSTVLSHHVVI